MAATQAVVRRERRVPVLAGELGVLVGLFAAPGALLRLAAPVPPGAGGVDVVRQAQVVVCGQLHVEPFDAEVALAPFERRHQRVALAELGAEDHGLQDARLDVLVEAGPRQAQQEAVGPPLARHAQLGADRLVVVHVVEAAHALRLAPVDGARGEVLDGGVDVVVVVRIVLEGIDLPRQAVLQRLPRVDVRAVRVERAVGIGRVGEPARAALGGHDVDDTAEGVGAEAHGDHALVDLDALGKAHGDVVQAERLTDALLRHTVDEDLDVLAREAVEAHLHVRPHAAALPEFQAGQLGQGLGEGFRGVLQGARVDGHDIIGRLLDTADTVGRDHHLA